MTNHQTPIVVKIAKRMFWLKLLMMAVGSVVCLGNPLAEAKADDLATGDSSVHYHFERQYGYDQKPHYGYHHSYHRDHHGYHGGYHHDSYHDHYGYKHHDYDHHGYGHGYHVKHGYHKSLGPFHHGEDHAVHHSYGKAHYTGYAPAYGHGGFYDHGVGFAQGRDAIGEFDHHTGAFGPFGFYANFYHD